MDEDANLDLNFLYSVPTSDGNWSEPMFVYFTAPVDDSRAESDSDSLLTNISSDNNAQSEMEEEENVLLMVDPIMAYNFSDYS